MEIITKKIFMEFSIDRAEHEHTELSEAWKLLDTKAQATTAIAGVFIAAAFAFVKNSAFHLTYFERVFLALVIATLVGSICYAILAMRIREVAMPITGREALNQVTAIFKKHTLPESLEARYVGLLENSIERWADVNATLHADLAKKASLLTYSHTSLFASSILILFLTVTTLLFT